MIVAPFLRARTGMSGTFEQARDFFLRGLAQYQSGQYQQAEASLSASLALLPGRPSTLTNLGATRLKLGQPAQALGLLQEALVQEPDNVEALGHCAAALGELGRPEPALACLDRLLAIDPSVGHAWSVRGSVLKSLGRSREAAASYREAMARGADPQLNGYYLAALGDSEVPPAAPLHYVEQLFDGYAGSFDGHLVEQLNYRGPQVLVGPLQASGRRFHNAVDLGCGTGLCGPLLQGLASRVTGVDLSQNMLHRAAEGGSYAALLHQDVASFLESTPEHFDLVVAADVFIYLGALDAVFSGVARVMPAGGIFCFSVEDAGGGAGEALDTDRDGRQAPESAVAVARTGYVLQSSMRYAHGESYIRRLAAHAGFAVADTLRQTLREDQRRPVPGLYFWLARGE
jgi:predicted TPR repeat methyltransferase